MQIDNINQEEKSFIHPCSINPIENEAVIASILEKYKGKIELCNYNKKLNDIGIKFQKRIN